jgi:hypothetical protein
MCRLLPAVLLTLAVSSQCLAGPPELLVAASEPNQEGGAEARLPYSQGSVYALTFIRSHAGLTNDYLKNLRAVYRKVMEDAKSECLILSYKVFLAPAANRADWDVMTMIEYKNMAALDGLDEKWEAIYAKSIGTTQEQRAGSQERGKIRDILGEKIVREIILK